MSHATPEVTVADVLPRVIDGFGVAGTGELLRFTVAGRMQGRTQSRGVLQAVNAAKLRKSETHQPFWHALFDEMKSLDSADTLEILRLAQFHQSMDVVATRIPFAFDGGSFAASLRQQEIADDEITALSSRVWLEDGNHWHIPMLDYRVPITRGNQTLIQRQLAAMRTTGWLFASGRSYHFVGDSPLRGDAELGRFLGQALLFAPIVDGRWVAHQLIEGACALRVSSGDSSQVVPILVARVG